MRLTAFILLGLALHVSAKTAAQTVTLSVKEYPLQKIFVALKKQTGYTVFYNKELLKNTKPVSVQVSNVPLKSFLDLILKDQELEYTIENKTIFITQKESKSSFDIQALQVALLPISGIVRGPDGQALVGVTVVVKGTGKGTSTDANGKFSIDANVGDLLIISSVGYNSKEVKIGGNSEMGSIVLAMSESKLDEVQVIAYGQTSRRLNTGNVSTVKAVDIEKQPVNNPLLTLQGRVPGVEITQATGVPGSAIKVRIRGQNSIAYGNDPLYVIDGVPYTAQQLPGLGSITGTAGSLNGAAYYGSPFSYINPSDIESIDVLKDADATAIYGSRGANGVVLITTKRGKAGEIKIDVNMYSGWGKVTRKLDLLDTRQYLDMRYEAFKNDGATPQSWDNDLTVWDTTRYTDWQKELIGGTAQYKNIQAFVSGGNANTQYLLGVGYRKETTVFPGDFADQKGSMHFNIDNVSTNKKFRILISGAYSIDNNKLFGDDLTSEATVLPPLAPSLYNLDGSLNWAYNSSGNYTWFNPLRYTLRKFTSRTNNIVTNALVSYTIFSGLQIKSSFGYTNTQTDELKTSPFAAIPVDLQVFNQRSADFANNNIRSWIIEPQITYNKIISKGELTALIGTTVQHNISNGQILHTEGFNSDLVLEDAKSASIVRVDGTVNSIYKYNALFGRLNYNYQNKYLVNLTARRDGTSRFGPEKQFHNFGAVGIGWIFTKENFIQTSLPILSFGKLRASYGTTGSDQIPDYLFLDLLSPLSVGVPYQGTNGLQHTRIFNPDLAWEETRKLEGGLELGFFKDRFFFTASYFRNRSSNQLVGYNLSSVTGFPFINRNLDALVQNSGWEFLLNTVNSNSKNFRWTSSFNLTINRNKLLSADPRMGESYQKLIGYPVNSFFRYHFLGVNPTSGLYQVADSHGDPIGTPNFTTDANVLIDINPKFYGGIQNSIEFKGFQLDFLFQFVKQMGFDYLYYFIPGLSNNQPVSVLSRWNKSGDLSSIQRFNQDFSTYEAYGNASLSDQGYSDASYIRLKNLSLSWQLPAKWKQKAHLQNLRVYIQGH